MSDVCLLHAVLLADEFEAKLARALTSEERDAIFRLGTVATEEVGRELERVQDATSAALALQRLEEHMKR